jgi:hypothetical protein
LKHGAKNPGRYMEDQVKGRTVGKQPTPENAIQHVRTVTYKEYCTHTITSGKEKERIFFGSNAGFSPGREPGPGENLMP